MFCRVHQCGGIQRQGWRSWGWTEIEGMTLVFIAFALGKGASIWVGIRQRCGNYVPLPLSQRPSLWTRGLPLDRTPVY